MTATNKRFTQKNRFLRATNTHKTNKLAQTKNEAAHQNATDLQTENVYKLSHPTSMHLTTHTSWLATASRLAQVTCTNPNQKQRPVGDTACGPSQPANGNYSARKLSFLRRDSSPKGGTCTTPANAQNKTNARTKNVNPASRNNHKRQNHKTRHAQRLAQASVTRCNLESASGATA